MKGQRAKMFLYFVSIIILILGPSFVHLLEADDDTYNFVTNDLPSNSDLLPTLGNGHVGFTVFSQTVFMNGLFNGKGEDSSRARIPNWANIRMDYCMTSRPTECEWTLNTKDGTFRETIRTKDYHLEHLIFPHRVFNRAIINQISVTRLNNAGDLILELTHNAGPVTPKDTFLYPDRLDIDFNVTSTEFIKNQLVHKKCGRTLEVEDERYQKETQTVCVFYEDVPKSLTMKSNELSMVWTFVMTADENLEVAKAEITDLILLPDHTILNTHKQQWNNFWSHQFDIQLSGDPKIASAIHASIFYIASSLPSFVTRQSQSQFFGLTPNGLGRGGSGEDYWGHNFWDTEIWMFPAVNLMNSDWARQLLAYRYLLLPAAKDFANDTGFQGVRFPWESGYTGVEVTPEPVYSNEIHITADVSFAMRHYFAMTYDYEWLGSEGCEMSREIARFFASRSTWNETTGKYDINEVIGPDEDHKFVNNNVFTNVAAGYALNFGVFTECLCSKLIKYYPINSPETDLWSKIAENLHINYDPINDYHPQYDGYQIGTGIKQADTVLLGFPLEYSKMNASTRANDLKIYENVTRESGPAMTWSMHAINHLDLKHKDEADRLLNKSYSSYIRSPFNVWCEYTSQGCGAVNFVTGAGGFLQVILSGYGGIRPRLNHLLLKNPKELPEVQKFKIRGLNYLGAQFSVNYSKNRQFIEFDEIQTNGPRVIVERDGTKFLACKNCKFYFHEDDLKLYLENSYPINQCPIS